MHNVVEMVWYRYWCYEGKVFHFYHKNVMKSLNFFHFTLVLLEALSSTAAAWSANADIKFQGLTGAWVW